MKRIIAVAAVFLSLTFTGFTQSLSNEVIQERIRSANAEDGISLTFDKDGKASKLMAVSENFARSESGRSGILAMNFALGLFFPGESLMTSPETFQLTFWVLTKKPRFATRHDLTVALREEVLVIGSARYVDKPREQMEYLNFEISRENLTKIASTSDVRIQLGDQEFSFTRSQMKLLADVLSVTAVGEK